jgi:glycosyltransferase involved in cell wall biosynthesis
MVKISIIGTRGLPAHYGGFETFAREISHLLVNSGYEVYVQCDPSVSPISSFEGARLFYTPVAKSRNPLRYYYYGIKIALRFSDILIVTGSGGAFFYFLNIFRHKIILTNTDGIESRRTKWSFPTKAFLRLSERIAVRRSHYIIADSASIKNYLENTYKAARQKVKVIEYGSFLNENFDNSILKSKGLNFRDYYLVVCRLEPENNVHMIIDGFLRTASKSVLVVVGQLTGKKYVHKLQDQFKSDRVIFLGDIYDTTELNSLRFGCKAYIHGHSIGGTNPSLLEAMGNGNVVICHDNPFNREVTDNAQLYFSDPGECADLIREVDEMPEENREIYAKKSMSRIREYYNWDNILDKYLTLFHSLDLPGV